MNKLKNEKNNFNKLTHNKVSKLKINCIKTLIQMTFGVTNNEKLIIEE